MSKTLSNVIIFTVGAVTGSLVAWQILKKKYEQIAQEEIDSVKETFKYYEDLYKKEENTDDKCEPVKTEQELSMKEYAEKLAKERYQENTNDNYNEIQKVGTKDEKITNPHVITPEEYGEYDGYDVIELTYYVDDTLADDFGKIYDVDETIGIESLDSIGEYEDDCVHVRNNEMKADFEVFVDPRKYSEVFGTRK